MNTITSRAFLLLNAAVILTSLTISPLISRSIAADTPTRPADYTQSGNQQAPGTISRKVRVGLYENKPKIFTDENGQASGIFAGILNEIARQENWQVIYVPCTWSEGLTALEAGRIDLMPDVAFSQERAKIYDFHEEQVVDSWSQVYTHSRKLIKELSDLNNARIALLKDSIQQTVLKQMMNGFGYTVTVTEAASHEEAFQLASEGTVDAVVPNQFFGDYYCKAYGLEKTPIIFNPVSLHFATAHGANRDLLEAIDRHLIAMKAAPCSFYYRELGRWMESPPKVVVPPHLIWIIEGIGAVLVLSLTMILLLRRQVRIRTRHLAEANVTLRENEKKFRNLFETITQGVVYQDAQGRITSANPAAERILGLSLDELTGRTSADPRWHAVHEDGSAYTGEDHPAMAALRTGRNVIGEIMGIYHPKTGETRWIRIDATPNFRPGETKPYQVFTVFADITERRKLEAELLQAQKMESVGRLAGGVAHDFNNLLSIIMGYADLMIMESSKEHPHYQPLEQIFEASNRAKDLTRQLLAFSRKQTLEMSTVDVNKVISGFKLMLERLISENISLELNLAGEPCLTFADAGQLEQVFMNMAVNARDAMPNGGKLIIETALTQIDETETMNQPETTPGDYIVINISDTGCGMDGATMAHIFEPFFTTKDPDKGTGLGLATSYGIIKQHGGSIGAYSEPGGGTTFKIYLPVCRETLSALKQKPHEPANLDGSETILLAEDNEPVRNVTTAILQRHGYNVICADIGSSDQFIPAGHTGPVHLLLTDVIMPGINGRELFEKVSARFPGIKVVYMSGYADSLIAHHGILEEGIQFIQKPFSEKSLAAKIRIVLDEDKTQTKNTGERHDERERTL